MVVPYSFALTTAFTQPDELVSILIEADTESIALVASWDESADDFHEEYLVEAQAGDGSWAEVGRTTDETFTYYLAPLNQDVRMRVSDSNGSQYSDPIEDVGNLAYSLWALTHVDGDEDFIAPILWAQEGATVDRPLDQTVLRPLSDTEGDTQYPIVFTGQWQGEEVGLTILVPDDDQGLLETLKRAARETVGTIAIKSPDGKVYIVQFGAQRLTQQEGFVLVTVGAIRVAA